jgi:hypothetical protein
MELLLVSFSLTTQTQMEMMINHDHQESVKVILHQQYPHVVILVEDVGFVFDDLNRHIHVVKLLL